LFGEFQEAWRQVGLHMRTRVLLTIPSIIVLLSHDYKLYNK
jgi:hypothetical protein